MKPAITTMKYLLGDATYTPLKFSQQSETFSVELGGNAPNPIATVVCVECAAEYTSSSSRRN